MGKLFGTDGIRGVVNDGLDAMLAFRVGMAAAQVMTREKGGGQPRFTIGKDTRISSDLLEGALIAGLCSAGADVLHLGVIPTPAVAWITVDTKADAGIVISASHNPFEHNGIKIFNGQGFKLSDELEEKIEDIVLFAHNNVPRKTGAEIGKVSYVAEKAALDYIDHLEGTITSDLAGLRILVDCANGASYTTAARLFDRFPKLRTDVINADPDGVNINDKCGSTHIDSLAAMVKAGGYDIGIAFDGDADRCLAVDEQGNLIDGDQIMAACGLDRKFAVRFSFLMSLPAVFGATILKAVDVVQEGGVDLSLLPKYLLGMVFAGVVGYFSIGLVNLLTAKGKFGAFAYYCWGAGALFLVLSLTGFTLVPAA